MNILQAKAIIADSTQYPSITFDSPLSSGSLVIGLIWCYYPASAYPTAMATDSDSGSLLGTPLGDSYIWVGFVAEATGGDDTITFDLNTANTYNRLWALEITGHDPTIPIIDYVLGAYQAYGTGTDGISENVNVPAGGMAIGCCFNGANTNIPAVGTGFTNILSYVSPDGDASRMEYGEDSGSIDVTMTLPTGESVNFTILAINPSGGDTTPPTLSNPTGTATGSTTADGSVDTDEGNGTLYAVVTQSSTSPTQAQVKAGQDHTGAPADFSVGGGSGQAVTATGTQNVSATGLSPSTAYYWHYMHEDAATNQSAVVSSAQFTTSAAPDFVFNALRDEAGVLISGTIQYRWWPDATGTGTQEPGNFNATVETGSQTATGGSVTISGLTAGGGWLEMHYNNGTNWETHSGRYTLA